MIFETLNEEPTFDKLHHKYFFDLFEVGLLYNKNEPTTGFSPDVIAVITKEDETKVMLRIEIKTREARITIDLTESVMNEYSRKSWCLYDTDIFNNYIPAGNRGQVTHQSPVANVNYGVFVTEKVEEEKGRIIQILIMIFYRLILTNINRKYMYLLIYY